MTQTTSTCLWNDSAAQVELAYAIEHGAVGATCNPVIVLEVLKKEMHLWKDRIAELIRSMPTSTEHEIAWSLVDEISMKGAELLRPIFDAHKGKNGRLSVQTDPRFYRDTAAIVRQRSISPGSPRTSSSRSRSPLRAFRRSRKRRTGASASTPRSASRCHSASRWRRPSNVGCNGANGRGRTSPAWGPSVRSWWAGSTTG